MSPKSAAAVREIWVLGARGGPITHVIVPSSHPLRSGKTNVVPFPPYAEMLAQPSDEY